MDVGEEFFEINLRIRKRFRAPFSVSCKFCRIRPPNPLPTLLPSRVSPLFWAEESPRELMGPKPEKGMEQQRG